MIQDPRLTGFKLCPRWVDTFRVLAKRIHVFEIKFNTDKGVETKWIQREISKSLKKTNLMTTQNKIDIKTNTINIPMKIPKMKS